MHNQSKSVSCTSPNILQSTERKEMQTPGSSVPVSSGRYVNLSLQISPRSDVMSADNFFRSSGEEFCFKGRLCIQGASSSIGDVFVFVINHKLY